MRLSMRPYSLLLPLLPILVKSQSPNATYIQDLVTALQDAGLSGLANVVTTINGTEQGQTLLAAVSSGSNYTLFAPTNDAIQSIPSQVSGNSSLLAEYLSYHFVSGDFVNASWTNTSAGGGSGSGTSSSSISTSSATSSAASSSISSSSPSSSVVPSTSESGSASSTITATTSSLIRSIYRNHKKPSLQSNQSANPQPFAGIWPNVTVGRTLLNASEFVSLPGNKSQVLAWTRPWENGNVTVLNQIQNVTVVNGTLWQNLLINTIDGYLSPPDSLSTALVAVGASNTDNLLSLIPVTSPNGTNVTALADLASAQGMTIFIPNNEAFTSNVNLTLQGLMNNQTAVKDLIQNHIVNGSSLYSPLLSNGSNATSAAGEPLQFTRNDTGLYVSGSNGVSARIVRPDVLLDNGVGHIIDAVLIDTDSNPSAATEAYSSAIASASSATATETGPLGIIGGPTSASQATTMSSASSSSAVSSSSVPSSSSASSSSSSSSTSSSASSSASSASSATSSTGSSTSPSTSLSTSTGAGGQTITVTASGVLAKAHVYASSAGMSSALGVVGSTLVAIAAGACLLI